MSAILSADDTKRLTGYVKPSKQEEWLRRNGFQKGVHYHLNAAGYPIVWDRAAGKETLSEPKLGPVP